MARKKSTPTKKDLAKQAVIEHLRKAGKKGGEVMKLRGRKYYQEIGRKGALARWGNKDYGTNK